MKEDIPLSGSSGGATHVEDWRTELGAVLACARPLEDADELIRSLVECLRRCVWADSAALTVPSEESDWLRIAVTAGGFADWEGRLLPWEGSVSALAAKSGRAVVIDDVVLDRRTEQAARSAEIGPTVVAPAYGNGCLQGVVMIGRRQGEPNFTSNEADVVDAFARHLGWGLAVQRLVATGFMHDERWKMASELYTRVAGRLFGVTAALSSLRVRAAGPAATSLDAAIRDLDDLIVAARESAGDKVADAELGEMLRRRFLSSFASATRRHQLVGNAKIDAEALSASVLGSAGIVESWIHETVAIANRYGSTRSVLLGVSGLGSDENCGVCVELRYTGVAPGDFNSALVDSAARCRVEHQVEPDGTVVLRVSVSFV
ncbi:hypothetical protein ACSHWB_35575 [Lentzea sp. HUAS TT2]|uniref:hypothetical protein n=1 Tax=Lentzea sp. HUAS TT2 TaxID=3447454 RepID=UPI003F726F8A